MGLINLNLNDDVPDSLILALKGLTIAGVTYGLVGFISRFRRNKKRFYIRQKTYPSDVVILHQFPRGIRTPSVSSFVLKLETWIRMVDIKYQNDFTLNRSPKGKMPWITYNGEDVADSQFCIEYLIKKFDKDLSKNLNPLDKSTARAYLKLNEESLRWVEVIHRFRYGKPEDVGIPRFAFGLVGSKMLKEADGQGYGYHTKEELYSIGMADLKALETFIGNKKFLMGDNPCNEDASIFSSIVQVIHNDKGPLHDYLLSECPNLLRYVETMKSTYWPDWNEQLREGSKNKSN